MGLKKKFIGNLLFAMLAQLISLLLSFIISLILPHYLSVEDFAYWQLFAFYSNYVNLLQFGLIDGMYLKLGGEEYQNLDYIKLGSQYRIFTAVQIITAGLIVIISYSLLGDSNRSFIFACVAIYAVLYNSSRYLGFIFQATNNMKWFSVSSLIDRVVILVLLTMILVSKLYIWKLIILLYIIGMLFSVIYVFYKGKNIVFTYKKAGVIDCVHEMMLYSKVGITLLVSNLASSLILGVSRQFIEVHWGLVLFGKVSFAFSIINMILLFINQVSLVMFPMLRKIDKAEGIFLYKKLNGWFSCLSPFLYIIYIPCAHLLILWLPQYHQSVEFLSLLFPICIFDGKMQLIYNTYMKTYRMEKVLLYINILSFLLSTALSFVAIFVFNSVTLSLSVIILVIIFRSLLSNYFVLREMKVKSEKFFIVDILFSIIFIVSSLLVSGTTATMVILVGAIINYIFFTQTNKKTKLN